MHELPVGDRERHGLPRCGVDAGTAGELGVGVLEPLHPLGRVQVERDAEAAVVQPREHRSRIGEQGAVPGVAGPAVGQVPVHVDDHDVQRQVVLGEPVDQRLELGLVVGVVARPPGPERPSGNERHAAPEPGVVPDRHGEVMAVAEEVPVQRVGVGPGHGPAVGVEHGGGVLEHRPPRTRHQPGFEHRVAVAVVDGPPRAAEVGRVGEARRPLRADRPREPDRQVARVEGAAVVGVAQHERARVDRRHGIGRRRGERGRRGPAHRERVARAVFEASGGSPLQPDEPRRQHGEARVAHDHGRGGIGDRIAPETDPVDDLVVRHGVHPRTTVVRQLLEIRTGRGRGWQRGQLKLLRFMNASRRIGVPQRGQGRSAWP